jgi:hypothetical protein
MFGRVTPGLILLAGRGRVKQTPGFVSGKFSWYLGARGVGVERSELLGDRAGGGLRLTTSHQLIRQKNLPDTFGEILATVWTTGTRAESQAPVPYWDLCAFRRGPPLQQRSRTGQEAKPESLCRALSERPGVTAAPAVPEAERILRPLAAEIAVAHL